MTDHSMHHHQLSDADAQAVDALVAAEFDATRVPESTRSRAMQAQQLFAALDTPVKIDPSLVDLTLARLMRTPAFAGEASLCADDVEALDAYVAAEFRVAKVPQSLRPRAERVEALGQLISHTRTTSQAGPALVERTMRRVAAAKADNLEPIPLRASGGFRFADLISVAAVLLLGVAVLWPVLSTMRTYQQRGACAANLGTIASAMGSYAADNRAALPMATASYGGTWLDVGSSPERSNSSNLYTLAREGYTKLRTLACSGNACAVTQPAAPDAKDWRSLPEVSYSYYIMFGNARPNADTSPRTIILADRSPVVIRAFTKQAIPCPEENSPNHGGRGQWALRANGTAVWLTGSKDNGDNIWLSRQQQQVWDSIVPQLPALMRQAPKGTKGFIITAPIMQGNELPDSTNDSFLGP
jgi:hypothetical protein